MENVPPTMTSDTDSRDALPSLEDLLRPARRKARSSRPKHASSLALAARANEESSKAGSSSGLLSPPSSQVAGEVAAARMLISPPPESMLRAGNRTSVSSASRPKSTSAPIGQVPFTPSLLAYTLEPSSSKNSSITKRKRTAPAQHGDLFGRESFLHSGPGPASTGLEATPNPKPRKQSKRSADVSSRSSPVRYRTGSSTADPSTPTKSLHHGSSISPSKRALLRSPHAANPNADYIPSLLSHTRETLSAHHRSSTPVPRYEPPMEQFTPPREVIYSPTTTQSARMSKSTNRKSLPRPKASEKKKLVLQIKKEPPEIDLTLPPPPASPTDDPLLLSGRRRRSKLRRSHGSTSQETPSLSRSQTHTYARDTPSIASTSPIRAATSHNPPLADMRLDAPMGTSDFNDDDDDDAAEPIFRFDDMLLGAADDGWSSSEDGDAGDFDQTGEYTGKFRVLTVPTKADPPSSCTRDRQDAWGRPISPFPKYKALMDALPEDEDPGDDEHELPQLAPGSPKQPSDELASSEHVEGKVTDERMDMDEEEEEDVDIPALSYQLQDPSSSFMADDPFSDLEPTAEDHRVDDPSSPFMADDPFSEEPISQDHRVDDPSSSFMADDPFSEEPATEDRQEDEDDIHQDVQVEEDRSEELVQPASPVVDENPLPDPEHASAVEEFSYDQDMDEYLSSQLVHLQDVDKDLPSQPKHVQEDSCIDSIPISMEDAQPQSDATDAEHIHEGSPHDDDHFEEVVVDRELSREPESAHEEYADSSVLMDSVQLQPRAAVNGVVHIPVGDVHDEDHLEEAVVFRELSREPEPDCDGAQQEALHNPVYNAPVELDKQASEGKQAFETHAEEPDVSSMMDEAVPENDSFDDAQDIAEDVVRLVSSDPRAAARAAAILKLHDYDCVAQTTLPERRHSQYSVDAAVRNARRKTCIEAGISKRSPTVRRRHTLGGLVGDKVYIPGSPLVTLPQLLKEAEDTLEHGPTPRKVSSESRLFKTPANSPHFRVSTPANTPRLTEVNALPVAWGKSHWKVLDACFTDERLAVGALHGLGYDVLAEVDDIDLDDVVDRFIGQVRPIDSSEEHAGWDREDLLRRARTLQKKQRSGLVAPPTPSGYSSLLSSRASSGSTGSRRFTHVLPTTGRRLSALRFDTTEDHPTTPVSQTQPNYSRLIDEAKAIAAGTVTLNSRPSTESPTATPSNDTSIESASSEDVQMAVVSVLTSAPPARPSPSIASRMKGFFFSYLPTKSAPAKKAQRVRPARPGLPIPPPEVFKKPRPLISTPASKPPAKPMHPKELVQLHPVPPPAKPSMIPRVAQRPQRLVQLHPPQPPAPAPAPMRIVPSGRRSSTGSVKDLVRSYESLAEESVNMKRAPSMSSGMKRPRSVAEGKGGVKQRPTWRP